MLAGMSAKSSDRGGSAVLPRLDEFVLLASAIADCPRSAISVIIEGTVLGPGGSTLPAKVQKTAKSGTTSKGFTVVPFNSKAPEAGALVIAKEVTRAISDALRTLTQQAVELGQLEEERESSRDKITHAQAEAESKDRWLGFIVHELNSPLTTVIGFQELLLAGDAGRLDAEQARMLAVANRNARRLRSLVADLLLLSRVESGRFKLQVVPINVLELLTKALEDMRLSAQDKGLEIRAEVDVLPVFTGDSDRLLQLIENLLGNAIKYTDVGQVTLTADVKDGELQIAVSDSGIGIPEGELDSLFDRFYRASNIDEYGAPGTGLGLAICQIIADAHNGLIEVSSELGKGSTFTLRLPLI